MNTPDLKHMLMTASMATDPTDAREEWDVADVHVGTCDCGHDFGYAVTVRNSYNHYLLPAMCPMCAKSLGSKRVASSTTTWLKVIQAINVTKSHDATYAQDRFGDLFDESVVDMMARDGAFTKPDGSKDPIAYHVLRRLSGHHRLRLPGDRARLPRIYDAYVTPWLAKVDARLCVD